MRKTKTNFEKRFVLLLLCQEGAVSRAAIGLDEIKDEQRKEKREEVYEVS